MSSTTAASHAVSHVCDECGHSFARSGHLTRHQQAHTGDRPYACTQPACARQYTRSDHLRRHMLAHTPELRKFACEHAACFKRFATKQKLQRHLALHEKPRPFVCADCGEAFTKNWKLHAHRTSHTGKMPYLCEAQDCDEGFLRPSLLKRHIQRHHSACQKTYVCSMPGCVPGTDASVSDGEGHPREKVITFTKFSDLQKHIKRAHPRVVKRHVCVECDRAFGTVGALRKHSLTHQQVAIDRLTYRCKELGCSAAYTSSSNLGTHVRSKHGASQPFSCKICYEIFTVKSSLRRHMKSIHPQCSEEDNAGCEAVRVSVPVQLHNQTNAKRKRSMSFDTSAISAGDGAITIPPVDPDRPVRARFETLAAPHATTA